MSDEERHAPAAVPWGRVARLVVLVAVGYVAGSLLAWELLGAGYAPVFFAPAGVTVAALLLTDRGLWPVVLVTAATAEVALDLSHGSPGATALGLALANTAEPWVGASIVRHRVERPSLTNPRHLVLLIAGPVVAGPVVGAALGATVDTTAVNTWLVHVATFWTGDGLGALTVGTLILAWAEALRSDRDRLARRVIEGTALAATVTLATAWGFAQLQAPFVIPMVLVFIGATRGMPVAAAAAAAFAITANIASATGVGPFTAVDRPGFAAWGNLQFFLAVTQLGAYALAVGLAQRDLARRRQEEQLAALTRVEEMSRVTSLLSTAATVREISAAVAQHGLAQVADFGVIAVLSSDGATVSTFPSGALPREIADRYSRLPLEAPFPTCEAIRTAAPIIVHSQEETRLRFPATMPAAEALGTESLLTVPIVLASGLAAGSLSFAFREPRAITEDVVTTATRLAAETAHALGRARRYEHEREVAHDLQVALLPAIEPSPAPGVRAAAVYAPADPEHEVGGDWYDVFPLPGGRVAMVVGDVVGHDLRAATTMARLQPLLRVMVSEATDPADALARLDRAAPYVDRSLMTTVGVADYDTVTRRLRYACAGHLPPLLLDANGPRLLEDGRGLPLGVDATRERPVAEVMITPPARLVWYTDGLVERRGESVTAGLDRLIEAGRALRPDGTAEAVVHQLLQALTAERALPDDVVILSVDFGDPGVSPVAPSTLDRENSL
ncbi:MAG: SpoIIE family protein phosphatase [Nocardioidaceae bacterium]|nr:SpoIIE family protein phosphatase [Nocardioidaceae bacterium]